MTRITISHCEQCGKPCAIVHDLEISACHYAKVIWKIEEKAEVKNASNNQTVNQVALADLPGHRA